MVIIKPRLDVGAPGVLDFQEHAAEQRAISVIAHLEFRALDPLLSQTCHFHVTGNFQGIARDAGNPRVAEFLRHHRQSIAIRFHGVGDVGETCGGDLRVGELLAQSGIDSMDFVDRMRTAVIAAAFHVNRQVSSGNLDDAAVVVVIEHHQVAAAGILPQEDAAEHPARCTLHWGRYREASRPARQEVG